MIAFCMCMCADVDADSSPAVVARVKALIWRIIQDSQGVLTHPSNTQGVTGRGVGGGGADGGVKGSPKSLPVYAGRPVCCRTQCMSLKVCIINVMRGGIYIHLSWLYVCEKLWITLHKSSNHLKP